MQAPRRHSVLLALLVAGCARRAPDAPASLGESYVGGGPTGGAMPDEAPRAKRSGAPRAYAPSAPPAPMAMPARAEIDFARKEDAPPDEVADPTSAEEAAPARMVHYEGWARLRVESLDAASDALVALATQAGGRVETLTPTRLVLRVPVAVFQERFAAMLATGEVLERTISAQDVTEAFQSVELRLQSAKAAQARLQALLAKAKEEHEKLALLRELQRLAETIDRLEGQGRTLADLAAMSRITLELVPRQAVIGTGPVAESAAFAWIRALGPFRDDVLARGRPLRLTVPEGMVALDLTRRTVAESADGARFRAARLPNAPRGDGAFWRDALQRRLAPEFRSAETREVGDWKVLRLLDRGAKPYVYVLAVRPNGEDLDLVEVYYPSEAHEARHGAAVEAVLAGGAA